MAYASRGGNHRSWWALETIRTEILIRGIIRGQFMGIRDFTCKELGEVGWSRIIMNLPRIYHEYIFQLSQV